VTDVDDGSWAAGRVVVVDPSATTELRRAELRPNWPVGAAMHGDDDPAAVHLAALDSAGRVVGACVLLPRACPAFPDRQGAWQLRGMVAAPDLRGTGIGRALTEAAAAEVAHRAGSLLWCDAREAVVGFYARHGFRAVGDVYAHPETGAPHILMYRERFEPLAPSTS
jgi:predicted GNAT family N-acyltransferase